MLLSYLQVPAELRRAVHDKAIRAVAPGGVVFVIAHHLDNLDQGVGGPPDPDVLFTEDQLAGDFADLDVESPRAGAAPRGDRRSQGDAIDVAMLARKPA